MEHIYTFIVQQDLDSFRLQSPEWTIKKLKDSGGKYNVLYTEKTTAVSYGYDSIAFNELL